MENTDQVADSHIEFFNLTTGLIFNHLFQNFPISQEFTEGTFGEPFRAICEVSDGNEGEDTRPGRVAGESYVKGSNIPPDHYIRSVALWLSREDYLHFSDDKVMPGWQLSSKSLALLGKSPDGLEKGFGSRLNAAVGDAATVGGRAVVSEIVGQIIGAAARGMIGAG